MTLPNPLFPDLPPPPPPAPKPRWVQCGHCGGAGRFEEEDENVREHLSLTGNGWWIECDECGGTGKMRASRTP